MHVAAAARCRCPPNLDLVFRRSQRKSARVGRPSQHCSPTVGGGVRHVGYLYQTNWWSACVTLGMTVNVNMIRLGIFSLFLCATVGSQVLAQDGLIQNSCTPREYETYLQGTIRLQRSLADARPGEIPISALFIPEFSKVPPQCQQAIRSLETVTPPGRRCTSQQQQEMIAHNSAAKWPQPVRTDCWNF
jgi:hypothetical protein